MGDNPTWSTGYSGLFGYFTFYDNYLYFPNYNTNTIIQTDQNGTIINSNWASALALSRPSSCFEYNGYLYITNSSNPNNGKISKISLSNPSGDYELSWATANLGAQSIVTDGTYFYVSSSTNGNFISRILIADPTNTIIDWSSTGIAGTLLALSNGYLYAGNQGNANILKIDLSNGTSIVWATIPLGSAIGLLINNGYLYASNGYPNQTSQDNGKIYKILLTDPTIITVWKSGINYPFGMFRYWYHLYLFSGTSTQIIGKYYLPPACFKEGSKILTAKGYIPIEDLRKGDYVRTLKNGFVPIDIIGKREITHSALEERIKDQLYQCSKEQFEELIEPLVITGCHCILVDEFVSEEQKEKTIEVNGKIYSTDDKYRLPACVDERTTVYSVPGNYTIYHIALENENYYGNYGIYANGLLVESCSKRYLKELAVMELIE